MNKFALTAALGVASLGIAACDNRADNTAANNVIAADNEVAAPAADDAGGNGTAAASGFPRGARIVEENGVTYRVDADGTRVSLGSSDSRIVVENGVRYRVDPGGTRVRINDNGLDIDGPDIDLPDVDVGINNKGNLDVDVGDKDPDGGR